VDDDYTNDDAPGDLDPRDEAPAPAPQPVPQPSANGAPRGAPGRGVIDFYNGQQFQRVNTLDPNDPAFGGQPLYPGHDPSAPADPFQLAIHDRLHHINNVIRQATSDPRMYDRFGRPSPHLQSFLAQAYDQAGHLATMAHVGGPMGANFLRPPPPPEYSPQQRQALTKIEGAQQQLMQEYAQGNIDHDTFTQAMQLHQRSREAVGPPRQVQQQQPTPAQLFQQRVYEHPNGSMIAWDDKNTPHFFKADNAQAQMRERQQEFQLKLQQHQMDLQMKQQEMRQKREEHQMGMERKAAEHKQALWQQAQKHLTQTDKLTGAVTHEPTPDEISEHLRAAQEGISKLDFDQSEPGKMIIAARAHARQANDEQGAFAVDRVEQLSRDYPKGIASMPPDVRRRFLGWYERARQHNPAFPPIPAQE